MFYTCIQRFDAADGERWFDYLHWLGRTDLQCVVSLDSMLCPPRVRIESDQDWEYAVCEDFMLDFFTDVDFVLRRAARVPRSMVLAAARDPSAEDVSEFRHAGFEFAGFDVVDRQCCASAILNCGGFPDVFSVAELSPASGLIRSRERAFEIRVCLHKLHPEEPHADCYAWALWRGIPYEHHLDHRRYTRTGPLVALLSVCPHRLGVGRTHPQQRPSSDSGLGSRRCCVPILLYRRLAMG